VSKLLKAILVLVGAAPATYLALLALLLAVPAGLLGTVGIYGSGIEEQSAGLMLLTWGLLGTFGAGTLWTVILQPHRRTILRALGLAGGIVAMLVFVYVFAFDAGTLPMNLVAAWLTGGPIAVAFLFLGSWGWRWVSDRRTE
jgi:hypothetical protein